MSESDKTNWELNLDEVFGDDPDYDKIKKFWELQDDTVEQLDLFNKADSFTIDLNKTYGATTTILTEDTLDISDGTYSITTNASDWTNSTTPSNKWDILTENIQFPWEPSDYKLWRDCMPSLKEVEEMCKEYPALQKAYENFKTIYDMVEQDYKGKKNNDS